MKVTQYILRLKQTLGKVRFKSRGMKLQHFRMGYGGYKLLALAQGPTLVYPVKFKTVGG
jgi:hypothetical protein